jgi:hypothetical protein
VFGLAETSVRTGPVCRSLSGDNQLHVSRSSAFVHYQRRSTTPGRPANSLQAKNGLEKSQSTAAVISIEKKLGKYLVVNLTQITLIFRTSADFSKTHENGLISRIAH